MRIGPWFLAAACLGVATSLLAAPQTYLTDQRLPSGVTDIPQFGFSVAVRGDEALIAAPKQAGEMFGSVVLYRRNSGGSWAEETTFGYTEAAHDYNAYVGCNGIAVDGDTVAIGTPGASSSAGAVQIFENRGGPGWVLSQTLSVSTPSAFESFGCGVALSGSSLIVGAPGHVGTGAAYVFLHDRLGWNLQATLSPSGAASGDAAGFAVAIDGDETVIGSPHANSDTGAAYVFARTGTTWSLAKKLTASDGVAGEQFGASVAVSNATVVIGAPDWTFGHGAVYAFVGASLKQSIPISISATARYVGSSVAVSGNRMMVGAIGSAVVYALTRSGDVWYQRASFSDVSTSKFGAAVALSDATALLGSPAADSKLTPVDHVYVVHDDDLFFNGYE